MLIVVFGLPGSGKSYFAERLALQLNWPYFNSDQVRKGMFPVPTYSDDEKMQVYERMQIEAKALFEEGKTVVLDATFYKQSQRDKIIQLTKELSISLRWIEVRATDELARQRVRKTRAQSDADEAVYEKIKAQFDPFIDEHLKLPSDNEDVNQMIKTALTYLGGTYEG